MTIKKGKTKKQRKPYSSVTSPTMNVIEVTVDGTRDSALRMQSLAI
jgi:hypothetical protein